MVSYCHYLYLLTFFFLFYKLDTEGVFISFYLSFMILMVLSIDMITCMCQIILKTIKFVSNFMRKKQLGVIQYSILRWRLNNVYKTFAIDE